MGKEVLTRLMQSRKLAMHDKREIEAVIGGLEYDIRQEILSNSSFRHAIKVDWKVLALMLKGEDAQ